MHFPRSLCNSTFFNKRIMMAIIQEDENENRPSE
jgi:hypothetical protein